MCRSIMWVCAGFLGCLPVARADDAVNQQFLGKLAGKYKLETAHNAGFPLPEEERLNARVEITADTLTITINPAKPTITILRVDASQMPVHLAIIPKQSGTKTAEILGILSLEDDVLKICWHESKEQSIRPKEFSSTKENKHFMLTLRKIKP